MSDRIIKSIESLKRSSYRTGFRLSDNDLLYIRDKGLIKIRQHARDFITTRIAPARPANDGRQTPMKDHPVFVAQHATATCCRKCISKWHNIPKGKALNEEEITFLIDLVMKWIEIQIQD